MSGVVFVNSSAGNKDPVDELRRLFADHKIIEIEVGRFAGQIAGAIEAGVDFVAVAGGDGTIRAAAEVLRATEVPLLPVPTGTRNHFATDLGIDSIARAAAAVGGQHRSVDVGDVNGRGFVNNSSIGLYPMIVIQRTAHEHRLPKWRANLVAVFEQLRHGRRFQVELDGKRHWAWMAFVGNGRYGDGLLDLVGRDALDGNLLDVRIVKADRVLARTRIALALLSGRLARVPLIHATEARCIRLDLRRPIVEVALDGEVHMLAPPLQYTSQKGTLRVLIPDND